MLELHRSKRLIPAPGRNPIAPGRNPVRKSGRGEPPFRRHAREAIFGAWRNLPASRRRNAIRRSIRRRIRPGRRAPRRRGPISRRSSPRWRSCSIRGLPRARRARARRPASNRRRTIPSTAAGISPRRTARENQRKASAKLRNRATWRSPRFHRVNSIPTSRVRWGSKTTLKVMPRVHPPLKGEGRAPKARGVG